jgi:hypothetical protein
MLTAQIQTWHVRGIVPTAVYRGRGVIEFTHRPTGASPTYLIRIDYARAPRAPTVWIVRPSLHPDARTLHRYPNGSLCLFFEDEWTPEMSFADTIVPWAMEWVACYELWLESGRWVGPEAPHTLDEVKSA